MEMDDFPAWQQGIRRTYPPLEGVYHADVTIVGGGLTGVTAAMMLSKAGLRVVLAEARRLGDGAAWACAGIVTAQLGRVYQTVADTAGLEAAAALARLTRKAAEDVRATVEALDIPCLPSEADVYTYAFLPRDVSALEAQYRLQKRVGLPVEPARDAGGCPFPVEWSTVVKRQLLLSPLGYLHGVAEAAWRAGCVLGEHSAAVRITEGRVETDRASIDAPTILLATGVAVGVKSPPVLAMTEQRVRESVLLTVGAPLMDTHLSVRDGGLCLRPVRDGMLATWTLGRSGESHEERDAQLDRVLRGRLPECRAVESAVRQDVWSRDGLPLIGSIRDESRHLLMAAGYGGFGVAGAYLAAQVLTRRILGRPLPEDALFNPNRRYPGAKRVITAGIREQTGIRLKSYFRFRAPRCSHAGCRLRYSPVTGRWECPCHGASFSVLGEVLDGPATRPIDVSARDRP